MKTSYIIVEDEPLARERIKQFAARAGTLDLRAEFDSAPDAIAYMENNRVDLIFLDINLGKMSGVEMLENFATDSQVIFTTAYQEYALKAFDLQATDYLLKPFTFERFAQAVERIQTRSDKVIFVKSGNHLEKIALDEILFIEGMGDYRRIHTADKRVMTPQTFTEFENQIPAHIVCRVHKSYMVAPGKIDRVEKDRVIVKDNTIPISETYKKRFFELLAK